MGKGEHGLKRLIVTADDFGLSEAVNEAVETAHRDGILTATSLMVGEPAARDAVERARRLPSLAVGLHLVVVDGVAVLPPAEIPALVDKEGRFRNCLACAGFVYFFHPAARRQLAREIRAQFLAFKATGLALDHVNAHHHMHLHPTVLGLLIRIGKEFGLRAIRLPREPLFHRGRVNWSRLLLTPWLALMHWRIRRAGLHCNNSIFGLSDSGRMNAARMLDIIRRLPEGVTEVFCHPASTTGDLRRPELDALLNKEIAAASREHGTTLIAFRDLG